MHILVALCLILCSFTMVNGQQRKQRPSCFACEDVVNLIQKQVGNEEGLNQTVQMISMMCGEKESCKTKMLKEIQFILQKTEAGEGSSLICAKLGHCDFSFAQKLESNKAFEFNFTCAICQTILSTVFYQCDKRNDISLNDFSGSMNETCDGIPFADQVCHDLMQPFEQTIYDDYKNKQTPVKTCEHINLCKDDGKNKPEKHLDTTLYSKVVDLKCSICQAVVQYAKQDLYNKPSTPGDVHRVLQDLCTNVPEVLKSGCNELLRSYSTIVESGLLNHLPNTVICEQANLCEVPTFIQREVPTYIQQPSLPLYSMRDLAPLLQNITTTMRLNNAKDTPASDLQCQACQWAVSAIEAYISQDANEKELADVLQLLCSILPVEYSKICVNFVTVYLSEALVYILDNLTPPVVCTKLSLCNSN